MGAAAQAPAGLAPSGGPTRSGGGHRRRCAGASVWRGDRTGPSPVDRRKCGTKHTLLVDSHGIPLVIRTAGANASDHLQILPVVLDYPRVPGKPGRSASALRGITTRHQHKQNTVLSAVLTDLSLGRSAVTDWALAALANVPLIMLNGVHATEAGPKGLGAERIDSSHAGRAYAAYGGVYIVSCLIWLWAVEKAQPDRWDLLGASICIIGSLIILFGPRPD